MENKKSLKINAAICDVRKVTEEYLSHYASIKINAATLVTSPEAQAVLGKCGVKINAATMLSPEGEVRFSSINGAGRIFPGQAMAEEKVFLIVNGTLDIESGSEEVLKSYAGIMVNGTLTCPESMTGLLSNIRVNGATKTYPDGAILLKNTAVLDRVFHLRAKQDALYFAGKQIVALAPDINFAKLTEKNVRFATKRLLVAESMAESAVPLFDVKTDIEVLPDGCAYVDDDTVLDSVLVRRYGGKLYIDGDLTVNRDSAEALEQVSYLHVNGTVLVTRGMKDQVLGMELACDELKVVGGTLIQGRHTVEISTAMLEDAEDGVSIADCAQVTFVEDITPALLKEKLVSLEDCARVKCSKEQLPVIEIFARDVAHISCGEDDMKNKNAEEDGDTVSINAAVYTI